MHLLYISVCNYIDVLAYICTIEIFIRQRARGARIHSHRRKSLCVFAAMHKWFVHLSRKHTREHFIINISPGCESEYSVETNKQTGWRAICPNMVEPRHTHRCEFMYYAHTCIYIYINVHSRAECMRSQCSSRLVQAAGA